MEGAVTAEPPVQGRANSCVYSPGASGLRPCQSHLAPGPSELVLKVVPQHGADRCLPGQTACIVVARLAAGVQADKRHDQTAMDPLDGSRRSSVAVEQASSHSQRSAVTVMVQVGYGR